MGAPGVGQAGYPQQAGMMPFQQPAMVCAIHSLSISRLCLHHFHVFINDVHLSAMFGECSYGHTTLFW